MKNLFDMMGQFKEMQSKLQELQQSLADLEVSGISGGGMVKVTLTGKGEMRGISIDPSLLTPGEAEILEDLIIAAHNDAKARAETLVAEKTAELTAGLPLPPGMKLPF